MIDPLKAGIFDTETTGLIENFGRPLARQPHIIEFFMVTVDHNVLELGEELSLLIKPPVTISEEIIRITNINNDMVKDAPSFRTVARQIADFVESHDVLVAHNAAFDRDMLVLEFERLGMEVKLPQFICTVEATEWLNGYRLKLSGLYMQLFGEGFTDAHRAGPDTRALARCYIEMVKRGWL